MTYQEIQDTIVSSFWSRTLKEEIARRGYVFPPEKLLCLAYKQTGSYTERLQRMKLFVDHVPEAADHARRVIEWMEDRLEAFRASDEHTVFDLRIDPEGDDDTLDYSCADFNTCLDVIDQFYAHYGDTPWGRETENACYTINKKRILQPGDPLNLHDEQTATLGPGKVITHIPMGMTCEYGDCDGDCQDCPHPCVDSTEDLIPEWIPDLSPVRNRYFKEISYGCVLTDGSDSWEAYIIPLDSSMFRESLEEYRHSLHHEHISWPNVEVITPDELPEELRQNYETFVAFWKAQYPEKYGK